MESSKPGDPAVIHSAVPARARSYLFVPASRPDRIPKARASGADAVIVDLEDAIAPEAKEAARTALADALDPRHPVIVRINGVTTPWFEDDTRLCRNPGVSAVMLPKAESSDELRRLSESLGGGMNLLPLVETARGLWNVLAIAGTQSVQRLAFGALDFQLDLGLREPGPEELAPFRAQLVLASRVAGILSPLDGPTTAVDDTELVQADAQRARRAGFGGKLCIHPSQVEGVNRSFGPTPAEITWARRVLDAAREARSAVVVVDGKMVDRPVLELAQELLRQGTYSNSGEP